MTQAVQNVGAASAQVPVAALNDKTQILANNGTVELLYSRAFCGSNTISVELRIPTLLLSYLICLFSSVKNSRLSEYPRTFLGKLLLHRTSKTLLLQVVKIRL
jgi:hypothetical protein